MKPVGSLIFDTTVVRTDEYVMLAKVMKENGSSTDQIALDIAAIDDLLQAQQVQTLLLSNRFTQKGRIRKNHTYIDIINNRIDRLTEDSKNLFTHTTTTPQL